MEKDETPWRTPGSTGAPLSGSAPKKYSEEEITKTIQKKAAPPPSASETAGEPKQSDYPGNPAAYNIAMRKWVQKQTKTTSSARSASGK